MSNKKQSIPGYCKVNFDKVAEELLTPAFYHINLDGEDLPLLESLNEMMRRLRSVFFPGFYTPGYVSESSMRYRMPANLDSIYRILEEQIVCGYTAMGIRSSSEVYEKASTQAAKFINSVPRLRKLVESDVQAAYEGDPAAKSPSETILCYPSIQVMMHHRVAHELNKLDVPLIPRIINEMAHSTTGIDIHPGAQIGEYFFIDHGTGVVIGETCIIGNRCRIYQGVTLGALSFPSAEDGTLRKGLPRHPILEDNVVVYSGATILGRVTIGKGSVIGGNVWLTKNIAPGSKIVQQHSAQASSDEIMLGK